MDPSSRVLSWSQTCFSLGNVAEFFHSGLCSAPLAPNKQSITPSSWIICLDKGAQKGSLHCLEIPRRGFCVLPVKEKVFQTRSKDPRDAGESEVPITQHHQRCVQVYAQPQPWRNPSSFSQRACSASLSQVRTLLALVVVALCCGTAFLYEKGISVMSLEPVQVSQ